MIRKNQPLLIALAIGLGLIVLSVPLRAQDRDQIQSLASNLSNAAHEAWNAIQYERNSTEFNDNSSTRQLYWLLRDFNRRAGRFAQESREPWERPATLRNEARQLVNQASRINNLMLRSNTPDSVRYEWSEAEDNIANLADIYNFPYEAERGLARRDYGSDEDR